MELAHLWQGWPLLIQAAAVLIVTAWKFDLWEDIWVWPVAFFSTIINKK
jgi:hypothetical protein